MEKPNKTSRGASSSATSSAEARRIRKRELDRHAQRCARQRTKDRIAFLEQRLEESYRAEPGQRRVAALLDELSSVKQQRDELMAIVSSIQKTLQNGLPAARQNNSTSPPALPSTTATTTALLPVPAVSLDNSLDNTLGDSLDVTLDDTGLLLSDPQQPDVAATMASSAGLAASLAGGTACPSYDITTVDADNGSNADLGTLAAGDDVEPIMPLPEAPCHCITVDNQHKASSNIWRSVNCTLMKRQSTSPPSRPRPSRVSTTDALFDEDVPVRAVLQGWQAVEEAGLLTAAWKKLKAVDELCFASCDNVVRLAVLTMMHIFLRWDTDPSPQNLQAMPQWYLQRPSQKMAHSGAIDYFVWPGVRERFVFSQHRYCSNLFWDNFSANLRILWAHGLDSCYQLDFMTGRYSMAPTFKNQIRDLRCWTMLRGFFDHFPELACDIPIFEEVPRSLSHALPFMDLISAEADKNRNKDHYQDRYQGRYEEPIKASSCSMMPTSTLGLGHGHGHNHISPIDVSSEEFWQMIGCNVQSFSQNC